MQIARPPRLRRWSPPPSPSSTQRLLARLPAHRSSSPRRPPADAARPRPRGDPKPTIVLVHGAFADSSGWNAVAARLIARRLPGASPSPTRCAARWPTRVPAPLPRAPSTGPSCWSATRTAARSSPTPPPATRTSRRSSTSPRTRPTEGESVAAANALGGGHTEVTDHLVLRPVPRRGRRRRRRLHRPGPLPPALRPGPAALAPPRVMAATQRPGRPGRAA